MIANNTILFITPEAYAYLKDWIDFRISYGEKIDADSWVMRDIWQTTNMKYGARLGLATFPKKLKSSGVKRLLERALWEQGLRHTLKEKERRHEWKARTWVSKVLQNPCRTGNEANKCRNYYGP